MVAPAATTLPAAPSAAVDAAGRPAFGAWTGHLPVVAWDRLAPPLAHGTLWRLAHAKRWHYVSIAGPRCLIGLAMVDLGWGASAFAYLFDREERLLRTDLSTMGVPGLTVKVARRAGERARSSCQAPRLTLLLRRPRGSSLWTVNARAPGFRVEATLDAAAAPPTLCAIAPIEGGAANCTHKTVCLPVAGFAEAGGARFELGGYHGALDHTSGLLARVTRWRWASASGPGFGMNLVEGFNGPVENAVWLDGQLHPMGAAEFQFDRAAPSRPWRVRTVDGLVDLEFLPEGRRREDKDLVVAASRFVQAVGRFRGTVRAAAGAPVRDIDSVGVTEDHESRW